MNTHELRTQPEKSETRTEKKLRKAEKNLRFSVRTEKFLRLPTTYVDFHQKNKILILPLHTTIVDSNFEIKNSQSKIPNRACGNTVRHSENTGPARQVNRKLDLPSKPTTGLYNKSLSKSPQLLDSTLFHSLSPVASWTLNHSLIISSPLLILLKHCHSNIYSLLCTFMHLSVLNGKPPKKRCDNSRIPVSK